MSYSPGAGEINSPDIFTSDVRCNLENQFLSVCESIKSENMHVYARVRPMLPEEVSKGYKECIAAIDDQTVRAIVPVTSAKYKNSRQSTEMIEDYSFNAAFGSESGQFVFFQETMLNTMQNFIEGSNSLVFSYGITGSGKTYTLQGNSENPGIIPLSLKLFFATMEKQLMKEIIVKPHQYCDIVALSEKDSKQEHLIKRQILSLYDEECDSAPGSFRQYNSKSFAMSLCDFFSDDYEFEVRQTTLDPEDMAAAQAAAQLKEVSRKCADQQPGVCSVWVSFVEIYNEHIFDLLQPFSNKRCRLSLGEDKSGNVYVKGAREICISNSDEALKLLNLGRKQLSIASTKMNYQSSRSHCIYTIKVVRILDPKNIAHGKVNRLSFCDLAGSERAAKTQTTGARLKEAGSINTSLLVLGRCLEYLRMNQIGKEKRMIPFRESKLTRIFSGFLLGQGKAAMIANASPSDYSFDETLHVLKFSAMSRKLLVNDTFLSNVSSAIQSITNQWEAYKANTSISLNNESIESIDSDSDIIQMKDDLIEKLLDLTDQQGKELAREKKEKSELEMIIRQDVCREYSEFSDQLIESIKLNHQEEMTSVLDAYKKRIANMEKMYESIIKGYKDQLGDSETDESFNETSLNESSQDADSNKELERTSDKDDSTSLSEKNATEMAENILGKMNILTLSNQLENVKQQLLESQNTSSNLEIELSVSKMENQKLSKQNAEHQSEVSKYNLAAVNYEKELKNLECMLSSARDELHAANETIQLKSFNVCELQADIEMYKSNIEMFKTQVEDFKSLKASHEADIDKYKQDIKFMEEKFNQNQRECKVAEEKIKVQTCVISKLEKEIHDLKECNLMLEEKKEDEGKKIASLAKDLLSLQKEVSATKEESEVKSKTIENLSEIEMLKEGNSMSNEKEKEMEEKILTLVNDMSSLQKNLFTVKEELTAKSQTILKLESEIQTLKENNVKAEELKNENEKKIMAFQEDSLAVKNELSTAKMELDVKFQTLEQLQSELQKSNEIIHDLRRNSDEISGIKVLQSKDIEKYQERERNLEQDVQSAYKNLESLQKDIEQKEAVNNQLQKEVKDHESKSNELQEVEVKDHESKSNELQEVEVKSSILNSDQDSKIVEYKSQIKNLEKEISNVCQELAESKIHLELKSIKVTDLENQIKGDKEELGKLQKEIKKAEDEKSQLMSELHAYEGRVKELENKFSVEIAVMKTEMTANAEDYEKNICLLKKEIQSYKEEIGKLTENLESVESDRLKVVSEFGLYKTQIKNLKGKIDQDKKERESLINEAEESKCHIENKFEVYKKEVEEAYKLEVSSLKKSQELFEADKQEIIMKNKERIEKLETQLSLANLELKDTKEKVLQQSSVIQELQMKTESHETEIKSQVTNAENSKLKVEVASFEVRVKDLQEKLSAIQEELELSKKEIKEKTLKLKELENESDKEKVAMLQANLESITEELQFTKEKLQIQSISCKELEAEISELKKKFEAKNIELSNSLNMVKEITTELDILKTNHGHLEEEFSSVKSEKRILDEKYTSLSKELASALSSKKSLQEKLNLNENSLKKLIKNKESLNKDVEDLLLLNDSLEQKLCTLQNDTGSENIQTLLNISQNVELKDAAKIKELQSVLTKQVGEIEDLNRQIKLKESNIEELEKALCSVQNQIQQVQASCDKKLIEENEQHIIEIEQTMHLKQIVQNENEQLKKENANLKKLEVKEVKKENKKPKSLEAKKPQEKSGSISPKNLRKSSRTLYQKEMKKDLDISLNNTDSVSSVEVDTSKEKNKKRVSDEDFVSSQIHASKKMKTSAENHVPVTRTSRKKLKSEPEMNLSPVQKLANRIGSKFSSVVDSVSKSIHSPRITRGKKRLFNPEVSTSQTVEKVTRRKRTNVK